MAKTKKLANTMTRPAGKPWSTGTAVNVSNLDQAFSKTFQDPANAAIHQDKPPQAKEPLKAKVQNFKKVLKLKPAKLSPVKNKKV